MTKTVFALVGPSGSGKTSIIDALLKRHAKHLAFVKTVTTRKPRPDDPAGLYTFVSHQEFSELLAAGRLLQSGAVTYAGNSYDNDRAEVEATLAAGKYGICALVEESVLNFRAAGYDVVMIRIAPSGAYDGRSEERRLADAERAASGPEPNIVIENDFTRPHGLETATAAVAGYVLAHIFLDRQM